MLIYGRARQRCKRALEKLFRAQSSEVMETLVECWFEDNRVSSNTSMRSPAPTFSQLKGNKSGAAFELVDILTSSAQTAVHMLCECITMRATPVAEKNRRVAMNPNV